MKVLLIQLDRGSKNMGFREMACNEPLGLEVVGGALEGHDVRIIDLRFGESLKEELSKFQPDACGVGCCFTTDVYRAFEVANIIKTNSYKVLLFLMILNKKNSYFCEIKIKY